MRLVADHADSGVKAFADRRQRNRVIVLRPRLEEWIIRAAEDAGLELGSRHYNLPENPTTLHREINRNLRKLERLIDDLLAANSSRIIQLRALLTQ